jgi:septum formation protein
MVIVLASASPRRSSLLAERGIAFRMVPSGVDESADPSFRVPSPAHAPGTVKGKERHPGEAVAVARELARQKAEAGLAALGKEDFPDVVVIGADTVVEIDGEILGKPRDRADAAAMLRKLSGRVHRVTTGVAIARPGAETLVESETSEVSFFSLSIEDIDAYIDTGDAGGKAGAYGIQSEGRRLVAGFRGCYYNIVGLPVKRLLAMLRESGALSQEVAVDCDCARHPLGMNGEGCRPVTR